jgi:hypothetical protein
MAQHEAKGSKSEVFQLRPLFGVPGVRGVPGVPGVHMSPKALIEPEPVLGCGGFNRVGD